MDKAALFIDQGYLSKILEDAGLQATIKQPDGSVKFENMLDYLKFSNKLCQANMSERFRTYVYDAPPYQNDPPTEYERTLFSEKQKFKTYLDSQPSFQTRQGICLRIPNKECYQHKSGKFKEPCRHITQKGVDVKFTIDLVSLATDKRIDKVILITGDSDFVPAIEYARDSHLKIILYYARGKRHFVHKGLFFACDERIQMDNALFADCKITLDGAQKP